MALHIYEKLWLADKVMILHIVYVYINEHLSRDYYATILYILE